MSEKATPPLPPERFRKSEVPPLEGRKEELSASVFPSVVTPKRPPVAKAYSPEIMAMVDELLGYIGDDECTEVLINGHKDVSRKVRGVRYHCNKIDFQNVELYHNILNDILLSYTDTAERIDGHNAVIEGQLSLPSEDKYTTPMLARVHIVAPPGVREAKVTIAKKSREDLNLDDLVQNGAVSQNGAEFLKAIARGRETFVVAGPTGAGKTTTLQAITHYFDENDRVVVIEETPELRLPLGDVVYLRATLQKPGMSPSQIYTLEFWAKQANRMRMDRVIVGETRGGEMSDWLLAANSGADGSATTVHANSPRRALDKILGLATKGEKTTSELQLRREIANTISIIVQCGLVDHRHVILGIEEISKTVSQASGQIQTNTLFEFDKVKGKMVAKSRPSDELLKSLAYSGVEVNPNWFN
jgi:pilus assembly protein CpaF